MSAGIVIVNGRDLADFECVVERIQGVPGTFTTARTGVSVIGRAGSIYTSPDPNLQQRPLNVTGIITADTVAGVDVNVQALLAWIGLDLVELRTGRNPDVMYFGKLKQSSFAAPTLVDPETPFSLDFEIQPLAYAVTPKTYAVALTTSANRVDVPIGTGPSTPLLRILGAATNPVVTMRSALGEILQQVTYTVTLDANDYLEVDSDLLTHVLSNNGVKSFLETAPGTGDPFYYMDPRDADRDGGAHHTFETSAGRLEVVVRETYYL